MSIFQSKTRKNEVFVAPWCQNVFFDAEAEKFHSCYFYLIFEY